MANLERRILNLETTRGPQDKLDGVSAAELTRRINDRMNKLNEQYPDWFKKLLNDPGESAQNTVRRMAMLGFLTPEQSMMARRHSATKRPGATQIMPTTLWIPA